MYCSTEETKTSNIYRLATILFFFFLSHMCINIKPHSFFFFFFLISLVAKNRTTALFLTHLSSQSWSQRQVFRSKVFWEVVEAWALCLGLDDAFASVLEKLLHICQWTRRASPWWQGWRYCCTQLWKKGDTCLVWGFMKGADSPQGDEDRRDFHPNRLERSILPTWVTCCELNCSSLPHPWNECIAGGFSFFGRAMWLVGS